MKMAVVIAVLLVAGVLTTLVVAAQTPQTFVPLPSARERG